MKILKSCWFENILKIQDRAFKLFKRGIIMDSLKTSYYVYFYVYVYKQISIFLNTPIRFIFLYSLLLPWSQVELTPP